MLAAVNGRCSKRKGGVKSVADKKSRAAKIPAPKRRFRRGSSWHLPRLTAEQVRLVRKTFALLEPKAGISGLVFYRRLFSIDPSMQKLFQSSIELQSRKLMDSLSYTVATLDNPGMLVPVLESLGRRHVTYGARNEHYGTVIAALLQTLHEVLGEAFTPDAHEAWDKALRFVATTMMRGRPTWLW